jgi:hypothetical protein
VPFAGSPSRKIARSRFTSTEIRVPREAEQQELDVHVVLGSAVISTRDLREKRQRLRPGGQQLVALRPPSGTPAAGFGRACSTAAKGRRGGTNANGDLGAERACLGRNGERRPNWLRSSAVVAAE